MSADREREQADREARRDMTRMEEKFYRAGDEESSPDDRYEASPSAAPPAPDRQSAGPDRPDRPRDEEWTSGRAEPGVGGEPTGRQAAIGLFPPDEADSLRGRWEAIQARFVDEPQEAVEKADALVGDVMQRLTDSFSDERRRLEREWDRGDGVSTEDLRVALKRYRSFFDRLLSV